MPARKNWFILIFLGVWMVGWTVGELGVLGLLLSGIVRGPAPLIILAWLFLWTIGGLLALTFLLWGLIGREVVSIRGNAFVLRRQIGRFGFDRTFDLAKVRNLRCAAWILDSEGVIGSIGRFSGAGTIVFDCRGFTHRFGAGLTPDEALHVVDTLRPQCIWS
ncbi:hypothetical protein [uncultured Paludibaculum sp.]|uniref:hypothetical protein n=1 Tax=uncultured Paludibaculum sp. TaxID=1765020 RepID=UPI00374CB807